MRTREKSYSDYGMTAEEVKYVESFCMKSNESKKELIKQALSELQPYVFDYIFESLVNDLSYEKLCAEKYIYIGKGDFYGYRRKGIAAIKDRMIRDGIWDYN